MDPVRSRKDLEPQIGMVLQRRGKSYRFSLKKPWNMSSEARARWDGGEYMILEFPPAEPVKAAVLNPGILQWLPEEPEVKRDWFGVMAPRASAVKPAWKCSNDTCKAPTAGPLMSSDGLAPQRFDGPEGPRSRVLCVACADVRISQQMAKWDSERCSGPREPGVLPPASPATMGGFVARPGSRYGTWR